MYNQPKVSVIIPVYNAEKYLHKCLNTIINQTLKEIEIICVDDGSTDHSLNILRQYAAIDNRIKIITQSNQYAGTARNNGMRISTGKYLSFLDADDWFELTMLETTYNSAIQYEADVTIYNARRYNQYYNEVSSMNSILSSSSISQPFSANDMPQTIFQITNPATWTKLFSADFIKKENILFQTQQNSNDLYFSMISLAVAKNISYVNETLLTYRVGGNDNIQSKKASFPTAWVDACISIKNELQRRGLYDYLKESYTTMVKDHCIYNFSTLSYQNLPYKKRIEIVELLDLCQKQDDLLAVPPLAPVFEKESRKYSSSNEMPPKVSVIIPFHNEESYLRECLDSIIGQTLRDIEIICVNDGSTDHSLDIVNEYSSNDDRITIISQPNGGLSSAKNHGLTLAHGEYVYFIDSDGFIDLNALEILYSHANQDSLDLVYFDSSPSSENDNTEFPQVIKKPCENVCSGIELLSHMYDDDTYVASACHGLISHELILQKHLSFYEGIIHEDELFCFLLFINSLRVLHLEKSLYHHRVHENPVTTLPRSARHAIGYFICMREILSYAISCNKDTVEEKIAFKSASILCNAGKCVYKELDVEERNKIYFEDSLSQFLFEQMISIPITLNQELESAVHEAALLRSSKAYRIGRIITWIPRKIHDFSLY